MLNGKLLLLPLLLIVLINATLSNAQNQPVKLNIGDFAPELKLTKVLQALQGTETNWESLKGKVIVIDFWATWCAPCIASMPYLNSLSENFKNQPVRFISVTDEDESKVALFLRRGFLKDWVGLDANGSIFKSFGVGGRPHLFVVGRDGKIAAITHNPKSLTEAKLKEILESQVTDSKSEATVKTKVSEIPLTENPKESIASNFSLTINQARSNNQSWSRGKGIFETQATNVKTLLSLLYGMSELRIFNPPMLENINYDVAAKMPNAGAGELEPVIIKAIESRFRLQISREKKAIDVFILTRTEQTTQKFKSNTSAVSHSSYAEGVLAGSSVPIAVLMDSLENNLELPVIDETKLKGKFDYLITFDGKNPNTLIQEVPKQIGLRLTKAKRWVEVLVVKTR